MDEALGHKASSCPISSCLLDGYKTLENDDKEENQIPTAVQIPKKSLSLGENLF